MAHAHEGEKHRKRVCVCVNACVYICVFFWCMCHHVGLVLSRPLSRSILLSLSLATQSFTTEISTLNIHDTHIHTHIHTNTHTHAHTRTYTQISRQRTVSQDQETWWHTFDFDVETSMRRLRRFSKKFKYIRI